MHQSKKEAVLQVFGLQLQVYLGCTEQERSVKQTVTVNIEIRFETVPAAVKSDQLTDTICFDVMTKKVQEIICKKHYNLIEHMGNDIFEIVKKEAPRAYIKVIVCKMPKIEDFCGIAQFELAG